MPQTGEEIIMPAPFRASSPHSTEQAARGQEAVSQCPVKYSGKYSGKYCVSVSEILYYSFGTERGTAGRGTTYPKEVGVSVSNLSALCFYNPSLCISEGGDNAASAATH